jgi:hypothetical protein
MHANGLLDATDFESVVAEYKHLLSEYRNLEFSTKKASNRLDRLRYIYETRAERYMSARKRSKVLSAFKRGFWIRFIYLSIYRRNGTFNTELTELDRLEAKADRSRRLVFARVDGLKNTVTEKGFRILGRVDELNVKLKLLPQRAKTDAMQAPGLEGGLDDLRQSIALTMDLPRELDKFKRKEVMALLDALAPEFRKADNVVKAAFIVKLTPHNGERNIAQEYSYLRSGDYDELVEYWRQRFRKTGRGRKKKTTSI